MSKVETITIDTPSGSNTMQIGSTNTATINLGVSGDTINVPAGVTLANAGTATGFPAGLSNADYWNKTTDQSISGSTNTLITGWSQQTGRGGAGGELGSGLTESSGIFSFSSSGIWYVSSWFRTVRNGNTRYMNLSLEVTLDNSNYNVLGFGSGQMNYSGNDGVSQVDASALIDCTDTSNVKFKFTFTPDNTTTIEGDGSYTQSGLIAMRLGDT